MYRLREFGRRLDRLALHARPAIYGDFVYEPWAHEVWGKRLMLAKLLDPMKGSDLIPHMENARVVRVRRGLLVIGVEVVARASKSKGERFRQSWLCAPARIQPDQWLSPPRSVTAKGFDAADDS